ncbi:hypothetical protein F4604DRAFT_1921073 [Suillus subluteus]|nr:hypothetical protein F4604DRAFT_1921073 [Suillus subluteus]
MNPYTAKWLVRAADTEAYLLLSNQPWRHFTLILLFTNGYNDLRVLLYDHSSGIVSPYCNISHQPNTFAQIITTVIFGSSECIRYDPTITFFKNVPLPLPPGAHMPGCRLFKNIPAQANTTCDIVITSSLDVLPEDPQEGPSSGTLKVKPMPLHDSPHNSRDERPTSPSPLSSPLSPLSPSHLPLPLPPLEATSAPLLNLASQTPVGVDDSSFSATPHPSKYPHTPQSPAEPCGKIRIKNKLCNIKKIIFMTKGLVGRGFVCYLVNLDKEEYIIKDHWVQGDEDKVMNEIMMLEAMRSIPGVPELVDYWMVERLDGKADKTKNYCHPHVADVASILGTYHTHICLIMKPRARPLTEFRTLREFVKALRDIVIIQCAAVLECNVLHRDCSLYNAMIVDELGDSRGLLIDWEFAEFISENDEYTIGGTGMIPFMSCRLLAQVVDLQAQAAKQQSRKSSSNTPALPISRVSQSYADNLKSLFYVFIYTCIKYSGTHGKEHQEPANDLPHDILPDSWMTLDLDVCKLRKVYCFAVSSEEAHIVNQFHPYFADLIPLAKEWRTLLKDNMEIQVTFDSVLDVLERHLVALLEDVSLFSSTKENLKKFAVNLDDRVRHSKHIAEWESSIQAASPISTQSANLKQKRAEDESG